MALIILFFVSLLFGQLGAISPVPGVYIYLHDVTLGILVLFSFLRLRDLRFKIYDLRLFWPIIAFLAASILSVVLNANRLDQPALIRSLPILAAGDIMRSSISSLPAQNGPRFGCWGYTLPALALRSSA